MADFIPRLMLDADSTVHNFLKALRECRSEQTLGNDAVGVHTRDIQKRHVSVHTRLCIDVSALADFFFLIG